MGGHVAGVYAAQNPTNLCSLTLICPSGKLSTSFQEWLFHLQKRPSSNCSHFSRPPLSHWDKVDSGFERVSGEATDRLTSSDPLHAPGTQEPSEVGLPQACRAAQASEFYSWCWKTEFDSLKHCSMPKSQVVSESKNSWLCQTLLNAE